MKSDPHASAMIRHFRKNAVIDFSLTTEHFEVLTLLALRQHLWAFDDFTYMITLQKICYCFCAGVCCISAKVTR